MAARRTLRLHDTAFRDFLADLNQQTGIRFFADPSIADDRLTLYAHDRPLAETLRAVAAGFRFDWRRDGQPGDYAYTLYQGQASRRQEEAERERRVTEAVDRIQEETAVFARLDLLPDEQATARAAAIPGRLEQEKDPAQRRALIMEQTLAGLYLARAEWRLVLQFARSLSREELLALMRAGTTDYAWPAILGQREFPPAVADRLRQMRARETGAAPSPLGPFNYLRLRFTAVEGLSPGLHWRLTLGRRGVSYTSSAGFEGALPVVAPSDTESGEPVEPADWQRDPVLAAPVSVRLTPSSPVPSSGDAASGLRADRRAGEAPRTLGDLLDALDRDHPADILADAFWSTRLAGTPIYQGARGEVLTRLARATGHRWWRQDGFIMLRSRAYASDRRAEPPATAVSRWTARYAAGLVDLDDYAEMAALPEARFQTLVEMATRQALPAAFAQTVAPRRHLLLWQSLTRAQRRQAGRDGLSYAQLTPVQQALFRRGMAELLPPYGLRAGDVTPGAKARFRMEKLENRFWGLRRESERVARLTGRSGLALILPSREEAVRYFQQMDSDVKPEDVREGVCTNYSFSYEGLEDRPALIAWLTLPVRWLN